MRLQSMVLSLAIVAIVSPMMLAQDMPLSQVILPNEGWQIVSEGLGFADGVTPDAQGNVYFCDLSKNKILKVDDAGKITEFTAESGRASGLKFGPEGRLYAAEGGTKKIVYFDSTGKETVLATDVAPNDLVVTKAGGVYFTDTAAKRVWYIDPQGNKRVVDEGIEAPNGIALWNDQKTLVVSDYHGANLWVFRIEADGSLKFKAPYSTMRMLPGQKQSAGDGMTVDSKGRMYVCNAAGLQMFDTTGREGGVIAKPQAKAIVSVCFGGPNMEYLYVASGDKVFRRKTATTGVKP